MEAANPSSRIKRYNQRVIRSLGLSSLLLVALAGCGPKEPHAKLVEGRTIEAQTATVRKGAIPRTVVAPGRMESKLRADLSPKIMGRVTRVAVREGDRVRAGQVLVELEAADLSAQVDVSRANLQAAQVGLTNARTAAQMTSQTSTARLEQAEASLRQARAARSAAEARLRLAQEGPRTQERNQARLAVELAQANLDLANSELARTERLYEAGAIAKRQLEQAQTAQRVAQAQHASALESERIAQEGTRVQDLQQAEEGVRQAEGAVAQAEAAVAEARAGRLEARLSQDEIKSAEARVRQSAASTRAAQVARGYATLVAPFDGLVVARRADPGTTAAPGGALLTIEGGPMWLLAETPASAMSSVRLGTSAEAVVGDQSARGRVVEIVPASDPRSDRQTVKVEIERAAGMVSGVFGRATFKVGEREAILIPAEAVWERDGLAYAYALNAEGVVRLRMITVGERHGPDVEVRSGLEPGEKVVLGGPEAARDGDRIR